MMKAAVVGNFRRYTRPLEGDVPWMYLDVRGLVTVGNGNLIDPLPEAKKLPFRWRDSLRPATASEIEDEWRAMKSNPALAKAGHVAAGRVARLELADKEIGRMVLDRLAANERALIGAARITGWTGWPADAQMGLMSMAWAVGVGRILSGFPRFLAAAREFDFDGCAKECEIDTAGNPGIVPRNEAQRLCFRHAARVMRRDLDPEYLHYPDPIQEGA
jgi:hypothetical protein